jgi:hypothetical protein
MASQGAVQFAEGAQCPASDEGKVTVHPGLQQRASLRVAAQVDQCRAEADLSGSAVDAVTIRPQDRHSLLEHADGLVVAPLFDDHGPKKAQNPRRAAGVGERVVHLQVGGVEFEGGIGPGLGRSGRAGVVLAAVGRGQGLA